MGRNRPSSNFRKKNKKVRERKIRDKTKLGPGHSDHHLCAKCRKEEGFNVHITDNIKNIEHKSHQALHSLFGVDLPHEQLHERYNLHKPILGEKSDEILECLINMKLEEFYSKKIYRGDK